MKRKIFITLTAFLIIFVSSFTLVLAQTAGPGNSIGISIQNPLKSEYDTIPKLFNAVINNIILPIGGMVAVLSFIWVGFMFVRAQGNEGELKKAKSAFLYTAIGTILLLGAWVISGVITGTIEQLRG